MGIATARTSTRRGATDGKLTLDEFVESVYLPSRLGSSQGWQEQLRISSRALSRWARKPLAIGQVTETLILQFLAWYCRDHAPSTTNDRRTQLLAIVTYAYKHGYTADNPADWEVPRLREPRRLVTAWTKEEVARLLVEAQKLNGKIVGIPRNLWYYSLILTAWDTSAPIQPLLSAETRNLSFSRGFLILYRRKTRREYLFWLADSTLAAIATHFSPHRRLIWPWPHDRRHLFRQFRRRIVEAAGLKAEASLGLFHKLRRSKLTDVIRTESLENARRLAGHAKAELTWERYVDQTIADPGIRPASLEPEGGDGQMWFI